MIEIEIEENAILQRNPDVKQKLVDILERYQEVFSSPEKAKGQTSLIQFQNKRVPGSNL